MCGILGMAGNGILTKDLEVFHELALISQLRGIDGAGFYQVNTRAEKAVHNREMLEKTGDDYNSFRFNLEMRRYGQKFGQFILDDVSCNVIIGHVRAATKGVICDENSHPFMFENLVGAHNGTLRDKKYEDKDKTDSELMFKDMNERGIKDVLEDLDPASAYAISVYNRKEKTITLARNKMRPLYVATNKERGVIYWASEKNMLLFVAARKGLKIEIDMLEEDSMITVDPTLIMRDKNDIWDKVHIIPNVKVCHRREAVDNEERWREMWGDWEYSVRKQEREEAEEKKKGPKIIEPTAEDKKMVEKMLPVAKKKVKQEGSLIFPETSPMPENDNKVLEFKRKRSPKIPIDVCDCCGKYLDLTEQFFAQKNGKDKNNPDSLTCTTCQSTIKLGLPSVDTTHKHLLN